MIEYFRSLTLGEQHQGVFSNEDETEVREEAKSEAISKASKVKDGAKGAKALNPDDKEVEKTFWLSSDDGWVINKNLSRRRKGLS